MLGDHSLATREQGELRLKVCEVIRHPEYDQLSLDYDVSILRLCEPVTFSRSVSPVCLPSSSSPEEGVEAVVTGWGTLYAGASSLPDILQRAEVTTLSRRDCTTRPNKLPGSALKDSMLCAGRAGRDSCQGDSGGPLVTDQGGELAVIGVVRQDDFQQTLCVRTYWLLSLAGARVSAVRDWILDNMEGNTC